MKNGRTLVALASELERQMETKQDFVAPTALIQLSRKGTLDEVTAHDYDGQPRLEINGENRAPIRPNAHRQIGSYTNIPAAYYDRLLTGFPDLLVENVNTLIRANSENRMVRMLDGNVRAFLSDRYQRIENYDVASAVLPILTDMQVDIVSCEVTESKLYIKAVNKKVEGEVAKGDVVQAGVMITNSEVGGGALNVTPLVYRLVCLNGMILADSRYRRAHIGKQLEINNDAVRFLSQDTIAATDKAILMQATDTVKGALNEALFRDVVTKMQAATEQRIAGDVQQAVVQLGQVVALSQAEISGVLKTLIEHGQECGGATRFGLMNAVTKYAQNVEVSYDRSTELEAIGGKILDLPRADWMAIAA